ncbi:MAG: WYL domain-containing protein [Bacteroidales bacterium]|nr:WYL domain-containing protein [Bacteroidales bacterium]
MYFSDEESYLVNNLIDALSPTNALKAGLKKKLAVIYDSTGIEGFVDRKSNAAHVANLRKAAQEKKMVILHNYESANGNDVRDRLVEPFGFTNDFIEVWAYDTESKGNKTFKVQRIGEVEILDRNWEYEVSHRTQGRDIFRMSGYANAHVRMQLTVRAKNLLIEEYPLAEKQIVRDGNYWILDTVVNDFAGICRYYVGLIPEIKVLEGEEFLEYARAYLKKYAKKIQYRRRWPRR